MISEQQKMAGSGVALMRPCRSEAEPLETAEAAFGQLAVVNLIRTTFCDHIFVFAMIRGVTLLFKGLHSQRFAGISYSQPTLPGRIGDFEARHLGLNARIRTEIIQRRVKPRTGRRAFVRIQHFREPFNTAVLIA